MNKKGCGKLKKRMLAKNLSVINRCRIYRNTSENNQSGVFLPVNK